MGCEFSVATPHAHEPQRSVVQNRVPTTGRLINSGSWEQLDQIDLGEAFLHRVPMLRSCPRFLRGRLRFSFGVALRERCRAKLARDVVAETRVEVVRLIPTLLLRRLRHGGTTGRDELAQRMDDFANGFRRGEAAQSRVQRGQVSRARHELTGAPLAPKTMETLSELRARRPQARQSPLPKKRWISNPRVYCHWMARFSPSVSGHHLQGVLQDQEIVRTKCSEYASMIPKFWTF